MTDIPALIVNYGILIVSGISAVAAVVSVVAAQRSSRERARAEKARAEAVQAQKASAAALDEANGIAREALEAQRRALPAPWGRPTGNRDPSGFAIQNTSGKTVIVHKLDGEGGGVKIFISQSLPARIENGDAVTFTAIAGRPTGTAAVATIEWSFEGSDEIQITERRF